MTTNNTTRLNQIIAVEKGTKSRTQRAVTDLHHLLQKPAPFNGITRTYTPDDEKGETFPPEKTLVQARAKDLIRRAQESFSELFDITATKDASNCQAVADIMVDGKVILSNVPVTTLLFLESQLTDIHTFIKKLPVLDPSDAWHFDGAVDCFATSPTENTKTKKVPRNHEKSPATEKHPAQVEMYFEDVRVGKYQTIKFSGALQQSEVNQMLDRVERLQKAVKFAREAANNMPIVERKISKEIFGYLFPTN